MSVVWSLLVPTPGVLVEICHVTGHEGHKNHDGHDHLLISILSPPLRWQWHCIPLSYDSTAHLCLCTQCYILDGGHWLSLSCHHHVISSSWWSYPISDTHHSTIHFPSFSHSFLPLTISYGVTYSVYRHFTYGGAIGILWCSDGHCDGESDNVSVSDNDFISSMNVILFHVTLK